MAQFESFNIDGNKVNELFIDGNKVNELFIDGNKVKSGGAAFPTVPMETVTGYSITLYFTKAGKLYMFPRSGVECGGSMTLVAYTEAGNIEKEITVLYGSRTFEPFAGTVFQPGDKVELIRYMSPFTDYEQFEAQPVSFDSDEGEFMVAGNLEKTMQSIEFSSGRMFESMFEDSNAVTLAAICLKAPDDRGTTMPMMSSKFFYNMFKNCKSLKSAYVNLESLSAEGFAVSDFAFASMFEGCTSLCASAIEGVEEPTAVTFALNTSIPYFYGASAFNSTFKDCSSLERVILDLKISATTLEESTFYCMFKGCEKVCNITDIIFSEPFTAGLGSFESTFEDCFVLESPTLVGLASCLIDMVISNAFYRTFKHCLSLNGCQQPAFLAGATAIDVNGEKCFAECFAGANQVGSAYLFSTLAVSHSGISPTTYTNMFSNVKIKTLVYPSAYQTDTTFTAMEGSPKFGAYKVDNIRYVG